MALIFADDFQQIAQLGYTQTGPFVSSSNSAASVLAMQAYGFDLPAYRPSSTIIPSVGYVTDLNALCIRNWTTMTAGGNVIGLRKQFRYSGDTVRFSFQLTLSTTYGPISGAFISFNDGMYSIGVDANGNYTVNDESTGEIAYYGADVKLFHEIVFTPTKMELWIGERMVKSVDRTPVPVKTMLLGFAAASGSQMCFYVHSMIVADNSGTTWAGRIGRTAAKTFSATAIGEIGSVVSASPVNATALAVIIKPSMDKSTEMGTPMVGSLVSPKPYTSDSFVFTKDSIIPLGAIVNIQSKRRSPSGDNMVARPFILVGAKKVYGNPVRTPSSLWDVQAIEIPIAVEQSFTTFTAGYDRDFLLAANKVYMNGHEKVEVYGEDSPDSVYVLEGPGFIAKSPTVKGAEISNPIINAYTFDYAKSNLTIGMTSVSNLTYKQDQ